MSAKRGLSPTMAAAIDFARRHGGVLARFVGGFWSFHSCTRDHNGVPTEYFGTTTIEALVARGAMEYSAWREGRGGRFPVEARCVEGRTP